MPSYLIFHSYNHFGFNCNSNHETENSSPKATSVKLLHFLCLAIKHARKDCRLR